MAHKYYCTYCARELNQDLVLLDMEPALTVSGRDDDSKEQGSQKFQILKFRLSVEEYNALIARGVDGDLDYKHLDLSFEEFAGYLANERNLNDPIIATLTMADIDEYLKNKRKNEFGGNEEAANQAVDFSAALDDFKTDDLFSDSQEPSEEEKYTPSEAILALKNKISTAKDDSQNEQLVEDDLSLLRKQMGEKGFHIAIKPYTEKADTGDDILIGYYARRGEKQIAIDARICCYCDTPVFSHAGVAEHRAVTFVGEQQSGKTSTILALTHYAQQAARRILPDDPIWCGGSSVPGIEIMEVVGMNEELKEDLDLYSKGVAPHKTGAQKREDAYSSTLWITNSQGQKFILTLIDLPGELCRDDGSVNRDNILNNFPVAMASDVFIMCFDTTRSEGQNANRTISNTCSWANEFQKLRRDYKRVSVIRQPGDTTPELTTECAAPMIIVFTKCKELENGEKERLEQKQYHNARRVDEIYFLKEEREFIDRNPVYKDVGERVRVYETLKNAYLARIRTSPYGFAAPDKLAYKADNSLNKLPDGSIKYPCPKQVDILMQWLMFISGCVPVPAVYCPNPNEPQDVYRLDNTYVRGAQYRIWPPHGATFKERLDEAMYRAYLFENYSDKDKEYIENYDEPSWEPWRTDGGLIDRIRKMIRKMLNLRKESK